MKIKSYLERFNNFINDSFFNDYHNWLLWCPIIFGFGILSYFRFPYINRLLFYSIILIFITLFYLFRKRKDYLIFLFTLFLLAIGYIRMSIYTDNINAPTVKYRMGYVNIEGIVKDISYYQRDDETRIRIIVEVNKAYRNRKLNKDQRVSNNMTPYFTKDGVMHNLPKNIRINMSSRSKIPKFGEYVKISANLIPIPKQAYPYSYNLRRILFYKEIGGIAYNGYLRDRKEPDTHSFYEKLRYKIYNIRENLNTRIIENINSEAGPIVASFITGIRGRISSTNYNNMAYAGLAHLISISGLHMAIVMGFAFSILRRILVEFENFALKHNIKKISAIFAIIVGFIYLCMTGFPVSANRAYIMSLLFFISILIEREIDTLRFLMLAGSILLFNQPHLVLDPSFQLSFLAVLGLVAGFKYLKDHNIKTYTNKIWLKPLYYSLAVLLSSIITEISTTPIAIYHFNNYTPFNMFTNLIAVPLAGFIALPLATLSILLMPFNLEKYFLIPAGWAIEIILDISRYVVNIPNSVFVFPSPTLLGISLMVFGLIWFMLWEQKWRYFGAILFIMGLIASIFQKYPDIVIDKDDKFIIIVDNDRTLYFSNDKNDYKVSIIERKFGQANHKNMNDFCNTINNSNCQNFVDEIDNIFRNEDILENFRELNIKYNIFNKDLKVLLNK